MNASPPPVLTIAGSDSSAGAGIQADLKTITAMGGYGLNALTSVVSELPGMVSRVQLLEPALIADQIRVLLTGFPVAAAKTGMIGGADQVRAVVAVYAELAAALPLVVDPVMVATGGGRLLEEDAISVIENLLLPLAVVITPNMDEAAVLWKRPVIKREDMAACAQDLASKHQIAVLVKGGHLKNEAADVLCWQGGLDWYEGTRIHGVHTHGTGCAYSAAIATCLAHGMALREAVARSKTFVADAIARHFHWQSPSGESIHALNHLDRTAP